MSGPADEEDWCDSSEAAEGVGVAEAAAAIRLGEEVVEEEGAGSGSLGAAARAVCCGKVEAEAPAIAPRP